MIVGGQTEARASTIMDYHGPFDQGFIDLLCIIDALFTTVPVGSTSEDFCPEHVHRNMTWSSTYKKQSIIQACPPGTLGNTFMFCPSFVYFVYPLKGLATYKISAWSEVLTSAI